MKEDLEKRKALLEQQLNELQANYNVALGQLGEVKHWLFMLEQGQAVPEVPAVPADSP